MSLSYSNYFPDDDLLCSEETSSILSGDSPAECLSDVDSSPPPEDEFIAGLIDDEHKFVLGFDYFSKLQSRKIDASAREESVAWILKVNTPNLIVFSQSDIHFQFFLSHLNRIAIWWIQVQAYYGFQPLTAYLAVNYMDRFLNSRQLPVSSEKSNII